MANTAFGHDATLTTPGSTTDTALVRWANTSGTSLNNTINILSDGSNITLNARGEVRFSDADSSHYIAFESPATVSTSYTMTLPADLPAADEVLTVTSYSGGAGVLEWAAASGGIASVLADTTPQLGGNLDMQARLLVGNGGSTGIAISANGEVTMAAQPGFNCPGTSEAFNVTGDGTDYPMVFGGTERFDQNGDFDNVSTFTAPVAGNYFFTGVIAAYDFGAATDFMIRLHVGGASVANAIEFDIADLTVGGVNGLLIIPFTFFVKLAGSDAVTVVLDVTGGTKSVDVGLSNCTFAGYLVQ